MTTGAIIAIIVAVVVVLAILLVLIPRMRASKAQHQLEDRRSSAAHAHRQEAERREAQAELAAREAERDRAEARLHATRAELHEQGLADDEFDGGRGMGDGRSSTDAGATRATTDEPLPDGTRRGA
jgi:cytochrome c-type biogenesis protein CcmH/NrfG